MRFWVVMLAAVAATSAAAQQQNRVLPGETAEITQELWGCEKATHGRMTQLATDRAAFGKLLADAKRAGRCRVFQSGTKIYVEDAELFAQISLVRAAGDTASWWVTSQSLYEGARRSR